MPFHPSNLSDETSHYGIIFECETENEVYNVFAKTVSICIIVVVHRMMLAQDEETQETVSAYLDLDGVWFLR